MESTKVKAKLTEEGMAAAKLAAENRSLGIEEPWYGRYITNKDVIVKDTSEAFIKESILDLSTEFEEQKDEESEEELDEV